MAGGCRRWHDVLKADAAVVAALVTAFAWPLVCVRGTWWLLRALSFHSASTHLAVGGFILTTMSVATMTRHPVGRLRSPVAWRDAAGVISGGLIAFLVLAGGAGLPAAILFTPLAGATFAAALAEEVVFRRHLPTLLSDLLRRAQKGPAFTAISVLLIPQMAFAAAHAENSTFAGAHAGEFTTLFVGGILYQGVARVGGLWAATAVHAAINMTIAVAALPS